MTPASPGPETAAPICAACGVTVTGRFCSHCGAPAEPGSCAACHQAFSPGARFCHHCGTAVLGGRRQKRERLGWIVAGMAVLAALGLLLWRIGGLRPTAPPEMGNVGNATGGGLSGRAPDISAMSPEQRFEALFDRIERAVANGDTLTVQQFSPMALGAYAMLDSTNNDFRFDAALIELGVGNFAAALALADSIQRQVPGGGHLFGYLIRGEVADRRNDTAALNHSYRGFLSHYDAEMRAARAEYAEHKPLLDDFRVRATASAKQP